MLGKIIDSALFSISFDAYELILKVLRKRVVKSRDSVAYCRLHTRKIEEN